METTSLPGSEPGRIASLIERAIAACQLDLQSAVVLTEAACGAYVVTPLIAAAAGASQVYGCTRATRWGSVDDVVAQTRAVARLLGVEERVRVITEVTPAIVGQADIITNSGHLRPISGGLVRALKPTAVVPLMYEAWEFRPEDVDLAACRRVGIALAGTAERHPAIGAFAYLAELAVAQLHEAGLPARGSRILLVCDNPFRPSLQAGLEAAGAQLKCCSTVALEPSEDPYDVVLVALKPVAASVLAAAAVDSIKEHSPRAVVVQFWGDIDRRLLAARGVPCWPPTAPAPSHMGILLSAIGPDPIVRLQTGGLKVGELLWRLRRQGLAAAAAEQRLEELGWGERVEVA